jgi:hypothetical protein
MVSAKTRDSAGRMPDADATAAGTVGQEASSRMRGAAASRAWRRVPGGRGMEVRPALGEKTRELVVERVT